MVNRALAAGLVLLLVGSAAAVEIDWKNKIRAALEEAEGRGVACFIYLTRDD